MFSLGAVQQATFQLQVVETEADSHEAGVGLVRRFLT